MKNKNYTLWKTDFVPSYVLKISPRIQILFTGPKTVHALVIQYTTFNYLPVLWEKSFHYGKVEYRCDVYWWFCGHCPFWQTNFMTNKSSTVDKKLLDKDVRFLINSPSLGSDCVTSKLESSVGTLSVPSSPSSPSGWGSSSSSSAANCNPEPHSTYHSTFTFLFLQQEYSRVHVFLSVPYSQVFVLSKDSKMSTGQRFSYAHSTVHNGFVVHMLTIK